MFIPADVFLKEDDIIYVTIHNGIIKRGVVGMIRYIEMPITRVRYTRMELKQVQDYGMATTEEPPVEDGGGNENPDEGNVELPED